MCCVDYGDLQLIFPVENIAGELQSPVLNADCDVCREKAPPLLKNDSSLFNLNIPIICLLAGRGDAMPTSYVVIASALPFLLNVRLHSSRQSFLNSSSNLNKRNSC